MLAVQNHGNVWMVVRLNSAGEVVSTIRSFRRQVSATNLLMRLYAQGAA